MTEVLTLRLGRKKKPSDRVGWQPGMTDAEIWEAGSKWWRLNLDRAMACDVLLVLNPENIVVAVKQIEGFNKYDREIYEVEKKVAIEGSDASPEMIAKYMGKTIDHRFSRNPVAYLEVDTFDLL